MSWINSLTFTPLADSSVHESEPMQAQTRANLVRGFTALSPIDNVMHEFIRHNLYNSNDTVTDHQTPTTGGIVLVEIVRNGDTEHLLAEAMEEEIDEPTHVVSVDNNKNVAMDEDEDQVEEIKSPNLQSTD